MRRTILHPRTLQPLHPLGYRKNGRPIWPILGGSEPPNPPADPPANPPTDPPVDSDKGFPENTAVAEMTDKQQTAYWKFHAKKHEQRAEARKDYDQIKAKADKLDEIERQNMTASEQQLEDARKEARAAERAASAPRLVRAEFRAAAVGRQINGQPLDLDAVLEDVDLTKYLKDDGDVDTAKVTARLDKLAPAGQGGGQGGGTGGSQRHGAGGNRGTEGGKPDVSEVRGRMERALGRRPQAATGS